MAVSAAKVSTFVRGTPVRMSAPKARVQRAPICTAPRAKYGESDRYFDLDDLENTLGSWDMYGQEDQKRYPGLQNEFFERAGESLTRREAIRSVLFLGGGGALLVWGAKGASDVKLPITVGPQKGGEKGPKGKI